MSTPSLLVTLKLDQNAQTYFEDLRIKYFPTERNFIPAHITLFHYLPGESVDEVIADLQDISERKRFELKVLQPTLMGNGVMFRLESIELNNIHADLKQKWSRMLKPQDLQKFKPHIVVQNKVSAEIAKSTLEELQESHKHANLTSTTARALLLWEYLGGPWSLRKTFSLGDETEADGCLEL